MAIGATRDHDIAWPELERFGDATPALLETVARSCGDREAVVDGVIRLNWRQVAENAHLTARRLTSFGVVRGDVVTVQLPNWWETIVIALAVWRLGAVLNPVTPIYRRGELRTIFELARPSLVVVPGTFGDMDFTDMSQGALGDVGCTARLAVVRASTRSQSRGAEDVIDWDSTPEQTLPEVNELSADDISVLMFTSGTTGRPKGVLHSHRTLLYEAWSIGERFAMSNPRVFMPSPLTHITGLLYGILLPVVAEGGVILQDRWNAPAAVDLIEGSDATCCVGATPFLTGLVDEYRTRGNRSRLESFVCGGADVPPAVIRDADEVMGTLAVRAYGLTEFPTVTCGHPADPIKDRSGDDGALVGSSQARLTNVEGGRGDLQARGPELFLGYLDPADNESAFTEDGWFRTGDLAELTGDRVRIVGRKKDIIVRGGENLSPVEVENVLRDMPGINDVAVVGVPDDVLGERACVMIVADGEPPTLAMIRRHLLDHHLAKQKSPEYLLTCGSLPRTATGKVMKYLLRREAVERLAAGEGERR